MSDTTTRGRIVIDLFTTLDGVAQGPGSPDEDPSGGFRFGGWQAPLPDSMVGELCADRRGARDGRHGDGRLRRVTRRPAGVPARSSTRSAGSDRRGRARVPRLASGGNPGRSTDAGA